MTPRVQVGGLSVAGVLYDFVMVEALAGSGVDPDAFWVGAEQIFADLAPRNRDLLARRDELQQLIDEHHRAEPGRPESAAYRRFLRDIGYLVAEPGDFEISTSGADTEITQQAGPQLVVPLLNARFAINARERPVGLAVRRVVRHRCHRRGWRAGAGRVLQRPTRG